MHDRLADLAISPSGFVFDPHGGTTFTVNGSGRVVLEGLRDGLDLSGIVARLSLLFDTHDADLARDVLEYVRLLRENGVLPPEFVLC